MGLPSTLAATLVLVRHGESTWVAEGRFQGRGDSPLSELGRRQAHLVAARLADRDSETPLPIPAGPPASIWHSPLARAAETAQVIAAAQPTSSSPKAAAGLTEIAQGEWEGQLAVDVRARWPDELAAWRRNPERAHAPGGEPLVEAAARVADAVAEIARSLDVTPAGVTAGAQTAAERSSRVDSSLASYNPVPGYPNASTADGVAEPWAVVVAHDGIFRLVLIHLLGLPLERFWSFPFNLAAITVIALHQGVAALRAHNLSEHLAPIAVEERAAAEARGERRGAL